MHHARTLACSLNDRRETKVEINGKERRERRRGTCIDEAIVEVKAEQ